MSVLSTSPAQRTAGVLRLALAYKRGECSLVPVRVAQLADSYTEDDLEGFLATAVHAERAQRKKRVPVPLKTPQEVIDDWQAQQALYQGVADASRSRLRDEPG